MDKFNLPNLLSLTRLMLAPLAWYLIVAGEWRMAAILLVAAIVTDVTVGFLARRWQQTSALGGLLDHGSDAILVTTMLAAEASSGYVSPFLPPLVLLAFIQYTLDSNALAGHPLRASKLGRYNGILYFVLAGFPILQPVFQLYLLETQWILNFSYLLMASTLISMADRLILLFKLRNKSS